MTGQDFRRAVRTAWLALCAVVFATPAVAQIDDHANTCGAGTSILADSTPHTGVIDPATDEDWFSFPALANREYRVELLSVSQGFSLRINALEGDCATPIADSFSTGYPLTLLSFAGQDIKLRMRSQSGTAGTYSFRVVDVGPLVDDHANTNANATPIAADASETTGVVNYTGDRDVFAITLVGGQEYRFNLRSEGVYFSSAQGTLLNASGVGQASAFDYNFAFTGFDGPSTAVWYCPVGQGGMYFFRVESQQVGTPYSLWVTTTGNIGSIDDHANTCGAGTSIVADSTPHSGVIDPATDEDWFSFPALANREYRVELLSVSQGFSLRINALEGDCATPIADSFSTGYPLTLLSFAGQDIKLRMRSQSGTAGTYDFRVVDVGPLVDDHANTNANATPIAADASETTGVANYTGDWDVFAITLVGGQEYRFNLRSEGVYFSSAQGTLLNASGVGQASAFDYNFAFTGFDGPSTAVWYCPVGQGGMYFFRVESQQVGTPYSLWVTTTGDIGSIDDHADACVGGTSILADSTTHSGVIDPATDEDWFSFSALANREYRVELLRVSQGFSLRINALEGDCATPIADSFSTGYPLTLLSFAGQDIKLRMRSQSGTAGTYDFRVVDVGPLVDDHANSLATANVLPTNGFTVSGLINYTGDWDVFKLNLAGGREYTMHLRSEGVYFSSAQGTLLNASGVGLASAFDYNFAFSGFDAASTAVWYCPVGDDGVYQVRIQSQQVGTPYSLWVTGGCPSDVDGSGTSDFGDFLLFFSAFDVGGPSADIDLSGEVDFNDFLVFFNAYDVGC